jgi:hypothetical protein
MNGFDRRTLGEATDRKLTFVKFCINSSFYFLPYTSEQADLPYLETGR